MLEIINMPTDSTLFRKCMVGCEKQMGRLVIQEKGISIEMMLGVMDILEEEFLDDTIESRRRRTTAVCGGALVILYRGALRGGVSW